MREADAIVVHEIREAGLYRKTAQVFAVLLPVGLTSKTHSVAIRTFVTNDFMTGHPARVGAAPDGECELGAAAGGECELAQDVLMQLSEDIDRKFSEIDFVLYDITSKPPATVEWQ